MLKAINTTATTVSANGVIPLVLKHNSNTSTEFVNNSIIINKPGYYKIDAIFNITGTATTSNITIFANGVAIPEASITISSTVGNNYEITLTDIEKVINQASSNKVSFNFVSTTGVTIVDANVSVIEIR